MKRFDIVRALKDRSYRDSLSQEQLKHVGNNPAGISELDESMLDAVGGASNNGCGGSNTTATVCHVCQF
jgi:mersacidin/lichenicidin family type 2 lantibiotic